MTSSAPTGAKPKSQVPMWREGLAWSVLSADYARGGDKAYSSYLDSLLDNITKPGNTNADLSNEPSVEIPWE
jgi:hypothetical protein